MPYTPVYLIFSCLLQICLRAFDALLPPKIDMLLLTYDLNVNRVNQLGPADCYVFSQHALLSPEVSLAVEQFRKLVEFLSSLVPNVFNNEEFSVTPR